MLLKENYTAEHIIKLKDETGTDPSILERTVYAFGLLEAIKHVGLPFIFKGGTSLLVLLESPRRLSTDIDIVVEPGTDVEDYVKQASKIFPFLSYETDNRAGGNKIEKKHFKFVFRSPLKDKEFYILLDVVFEHNPYIKVIQKPIRSSLLMSDGDDIFVNVPDKNCILGDKLTAFAPHTTGIPFGIDKELEIIKQLFDCWTLLREMDDYSIVSGVYNKVVQIEIGYRSLDITPADVLKDTIESCLCIMGRKGIRPDDYSYFITGINAIQNHIYSGRINGENAGMLACEVMYLSSCLLTGQKQYERVENAGVFRNTTLGMKGAKRINYIRNVDPVAYAYLVKSFSLLNEFGLYTDSIL